MSRPIRLGATDVARIMSHRRFPFLRWRLLGPVRAKPGATVAFKLTPPRKDPGYKWSVKDINDEVKSMSPKGRVRTLELWITNSKTELVAWADTQGDADVAAEKFRHFNPQLMPTRPSGYFPSLQAGNYVRMWRLKPWRNATHEISWEFGSVRAMGKSIEGQRSPMMTILTGIPRPPDGVTLVIQILTRRHRYKRRYNLVTELELAFWRGQHAESRLRKRGADQTFYADIRILEIHKSSKTLDSDLVKRHVEPAFGVLARDRGNRFMLQSFSLWTNARLLRFAQCMFNREFRPDRIKGMKKPHFSADEVAAFAFPPPFGSDIPKLTRATVNETSPNGLYADQSRALERALAGVEGDPIYGQERRMTAEEARRLLEAT